MAKKITKQSNGLYTVRVWATHPDEFGKRKSKQKKNIKTVAVAEVVADKFQEQLDLNRYDENITFKELSDLYLNSKINLSVTTRAGYDYMIPIINDYMGKVKICNVNTRVVQGFINLVAKKENPHCKGQRIKSGTIQRYVSYIVAVINWAVGQDILEYNRIKHLEYPQDEKEFEPTIISAEQIGEILKFLKQYCYNIYIPVLLDSCLGTRRGEALGLTWDMVDFNNNLIYLKKNLVQAKNEIIIKERLKTQKSKRVIAISDFIKQELLQHKKMNETLNNPFVCANIFTGKVPNPSYVTKTYHDVILEVFGINMRLHDLRHCFNHIANENDTDIVTMVNMLGHSNINTNLLYAGFSVNKTRKAVNLISNEIQKGFNV